MSAIQEACQSVLHEKRMMDSFMAGLVTSDACEPACDRWWAAIDALEASTALTAADLKAKATAVKSYLQHVDPGCDPMDIDLPLSLAKDVIAFIGRLG